MGSGEPNLEEFRNSDNLAGKTVSHFKVLELLERGPAGSLYLARDIKLERKVALRLIPNSSFPSGESKRLFLQVAKATSSLEHPNIGAIHEIDETADGQVLVAMAVYPGESLKDRIGGYPMSMKSILDYAVQLANAVNEAHRNGIIHRGIKPANILLGNDGILRLLDFGLAELSGKTGSVAYISPEQVRGDPVDERSDIWSLGVMLFEMLAGHPPFQSDTSEAVAEAILKMDPWRNTGKLRQADKISASLKAIIKKCLSKYAIKRYPTTGEVLDDLRQLRHKHRHRRLAALFAWNTVAVSVIVLAGLFGYVSITREAEPTSRFEVVDDPFGLGQGMVLMMDPGVVDTSINRLIATLNLPKAAHIHAVDGPHQLSTVYLKIGRPSINGKPGKISARWGLAAEAERQHEEFFNYWDYSVQAGYVFSGEMEYVDDGQSKFLYPFPFDTDIYYEIWLVIDHANNSFDYYIRGGSQFPTTTKLVAAAHYQTKTRHSLDHLLLFTAADSLNVAPGGEDPVYFDDFYVSPGRLVLDAPDDGWILVDNFESGRTGDWKVQRTSTGPMPKRTRIPAPRF
jgi:hypothetical protein